MKVDDRLAEIIDALESRAEAAEQRRLEADAIRAYCDAIERRHGTDGIAADPDAARWIAFARDHADRQQQLPRMPGDVEPSRDDLKPFLGGMSPYGPRGW